MPENDRLLNIDQAAERLNVPKSWLYGRIHARTLPFAHAKLGHYVRFRQTDIDRFIQESTRPAGARGAA